MSEVIAIAALVGLLALYWLVPRRPSWAEAKAEYWAKAASWRCEVCTWPKCAWSKTRCPQHALPGEWEAWTQHPDFPAWDAMRREQFPDAEWPA
jgi:hypothetical protein